MGAMDFVAHLLWTNVVFNKKRWLRDALLFTALPDVGYLIIILYILFATPASFSLSHIEVPFPVLVPYYVLHSLFTVVLVGLFLRKFRPALLPPLAGWAFHILLDIPTHDAPFRTLFLYPLTVGIDGFLWTDPRFLLVNYTALAVAYGVLTLREAMRRPAPRDITIFDILEARRKNAHEEAVRAHVFGEDESRAVPGADEAGTRQGGDRAPDEVP